VITSLFCIAETERWCYLSTVGVNTRLSERRGLTWLSRILIMIMMMIRSLMIYQLARIVPVDHSASFPEFTVSSQAQTRLVETESLKRARYKAI